MDETTDNEAVLKTTPPPTQENIRKFLLERCKDCVPYAPMILPEVIAYLESEISGDWSGWVPVTNKG